MIISAYAPCHITSYFMIDDGDKADLQKGSKGAGFCLNSGVTTTVSKRSATDSSQVYINGKESPDAIVSNEILSLYHKEGISKDKLAELKIEHKLDMPQGSGFGTSGAGGLSLSIALNEWFKSEFSVEKCAQIAHLAEIYAGTGLGTIAGEYCGGIEIRESAGAPGYAVLRKIIPPKSTRCRIIFKGKIPTKEALKDPIIREKVIQYGKMACSNHENIKDWSSLMKSAALFTQQTGLLSQSLQNCANYLNEKEIDHAMLMFGEGIYILYDQSETEKIDKTVKFLSELGYIDKCRLFDLAIDSNGGRLINEL